MNIGFIGLGKLGLPCALAIESRGHNVVGYDPSEQVKDIVDTTIEIDKVDGYAHVNL